MALGVMLATGSASSLATGTAFALGLPYKPAALALPPLLGRVMAGGLEVISLCLVAVIGLGIIAALRKEKLSVDVGGADAGPVELATEGVVGFFLALGLGLGGWTHWTKVAGLLSPGMPFWDPSGLVGLVVAAGVARVGFATLLALREAPLLSGNFTLGTSLATPALPVDFRLVWGSAIFGLGWGLSGVGLADAIVALARPSKPLLCFLAAAAVGILFETRVVSVGSATK